MAGIIHVFKIMGTLTPDNVKLKRKHNFGCNRIRLEGSQCDFKWK